MSQYTLLTPPDRQGVYKLPVVECEVCFALVAEDRMDDHERWHYTPSWMPTFPQRKGPAKAGPSRSEI